MAIYIPAIVISYSLFTEPPKGKSAMDPLVALTVMVFTPVTLKNVMVFSAPSKAYETPGVKAWVRCMLPKIMPLPLRVFVIVSVLMPVCKVPLVILITGTEILFKRVTTLTDELLLIVRILKVLVPLIFEFDDPERLMVLASGVKVPEFIQFPAKACVNALPANVVKAAIEKLPFTVSAPVAVFIFPLDKLK